MIDTLQRERSLTRTHVDEGAPDIVLSDRSLVEQMSGNSFLDEDEQDNNNEKKGFAVQQSEASSVVGNVENESKKYVL